MSIGGRVLMLAPAVLPGLTQSIVVSNPVQAGQEVAVIGTKARPELLAMVGSRALQLVMEQLFLNHNTAGTTGREEIITIIGHLLAPVALWLIQLQMVLAAPIVVCL